MGLWFQGLQMHASGLSEEKGSNLSGAVPQRAQYSDFIPAFPRVEKCQSPDPDAAHCDHKRNHQSEIVFDHRPLFFARQGNGLHFDNFSFGKHFT